MSDYDAKPLFGELESDPYGNWEEDDGLNFDMSKCKSIK